MYSVLNMVSQKWLALLLMLIMKHFTLTLFAKAICRFAVSSLTLINYVQSYRLSLICLPRKYKGGNRLANILGALLGS